MGDRTAATQRTMLLNKASSCDGDILMADRAGGRHRLFIYVLFNVLFLFFGFILFIFMYVLFYLLF